MNQKLADSLRDAMGYKPPQKNFCKDCKFFEMKDGFLDRTWAYLCKYQNVDGRDLGEFSVEEEGCCKKFSRRVK